MDKFEVELVLIFLAQNVSCFEILILNNAVAVNKGAKRLDALLELILDNLRHVINDVFYTNIGFKLIGVIPF